MADSPRIECVLVPLQITIGHLPDFIVTPFNSIHLPNQQWIQPPSQQIHLSRRSLLLILSIFLPPTIIPIVIRTRVSLYSRLLLNIQQVFLSPLQPPRMELNPLQRRSPRLQKKLLVKRSAHQRIPFTMISPTLPSRRC